MRSHPRKPLGIQVAAVSAILLFAAGTVHAQQAKARVLGRITNPAGAPITAASVALSRDDVTRTSVTDADGRFVFEQLTPGNYVLHATTIGLRVTRPVVVSRNRDVFINAVALAGDVHSLEDVIDAGVVALNSSDNSRLSDQIRQLPISARDIRGIAPGLSDFTDVGGSSRGFQSVFNVRGGDPTQRQMFIDDINVTNQGVNGRFVQNVSVEAVQDVEIRRGSASAQYGNGASVGTLNIVTKSGSNMFHGAAVYVGSPQAFVADPEATPYGGARLGYAGDVAANFGGPIKKDHVQFFLNGNIDHVDRNIFGAYTETSREYSSLGLLGKINWLLKDNAKVTSTVQRSRYETGEGSFTWAPAALLKREGPSDFGGLRLNYLVTPSLLASANGSYVRSNFTDSPVGTDSPYEDVQDVIQGGNFTRATKQHSWSVGGSVQWDPGQRFGFTHSLAVGTDIRGVYDRVHNDYASGQFVSRNAAPTPPIVAKTPRAVNFGTSTSTLSASVSDQLTRDRWTINAGLFGRWDRGKNLASNATASLIEPVNVPGASYAGDSKNVLEWNSYGTRVGFAWDPLGNEKTVIRGGYSMSYDLPQIDTIRSVNAFATSSFFPNGSLLHFFTDSNANDFYDTGEPIFTPLVYQGSIPLSDVNYLNPRGQIQSTYAPRTHALTASVQWELNASNSLSVFNTWRKDTDILDNQTLVTVGGIVQPAQAANYTPQPFTYTLKGTTSVKDVYFLNAGITRTGGVRVVNGDRTRTAFSSLVTFKHQGMSGGYLKASANMGWSEWRVPRSPSGSPNVYGFDTLDGGDVAPTSPSAIKPWVNIDSPFSYELTKYKPFPCGFDVAVRGSGRMGYPSIQTLSAAFGSQREIVYVGSERLNSIFMLDARVGKRFQIGSGTLNGGVSVFNMFNDNTALQRVGGVGASDFGRNVDPLGGRVARLDVRWDF